MAVKEGFKNTELGLIPEDWEVGEVGSLTTKIGSGITPTGGERVYKKIGRPFVRSQNVLWGKMSLKDMAYIDERTHKSFEDTEIKENDVLLNISGASIGRSVVAYTTVVGGNVNQHVCIIRPIESYVQYQFLCSFLLSEKGQKFINDFQAGGNRQGLNFKQIATIIMPIPPLPEQKAIATTLSDIDGLISSLTKLIEKKKNIKQGAMQELLTGRKRLYGFSGEWMEVRLADIAWFQEGPGVRTYQFTNAGMKLLNGTNIQHGKLDLSNTDRYISLEEAYGAYSHFLADKGDVVIASSGVSIEKFHEKVTEVRKQHLPFCMNTSTIRFKVKNFADKYFLINFLKSSDFKSQIGGEATGSAQLNFGPAHLDKVVVRIPPTEYEQTTIGSLLHDMDGEIELLTMKLNKYKAIKQGMMQELLTGRIRLLEGA